MGGWDRLSLERTPTSPSSMGIRSVPTREWKRPLSMARYSATGRATGRNAPPGRRHSSPSRNRSGRGHPLLTARTWRLAMNKAPMLLAISVAPVASVFAETYLITNARIVPVSAPTVERGSVLVKDGKIAEMGAQIKAPAGAKKIDGTGLTGYPGLIDGYTSLGLAENSSVRGSVDTTEIGAYNPQAQAWIAVNPHSEMIRTARANGVAAALVAPSGGRISGVAGAINLFGAYPDQMLLRPRVGVVLNIPRIHRRGASGGPPSPTGACPAAGPEQRRPPRVI